MRFTGQFFSLKFVETVFVSSSYNSISLSHLITESSIILAKYSIFHNYMQQNSKYITFFTLASNYIVISPLIRITFPTIKFAFTFAWYMLCFNPLLAIDATWRHLICMHLENLKVPQRRSAHVIELVFSRNISFQSLKMATGCMWSKE